MGFREASNCFSTSKIILFDDCVVEYDVIFALDLHLWNLN